MTRDLERARAFVSRYRIGIGRLGPAAPVAELAAELAAVRADERAAIVAWLRRTALTLGNLNDFQVLATASNDVEGGAHLDPSS